MGIYSGSNNFFGSRNYDIEPAQGYDDGAISAQVVMIENVQNQMAMFDGVILSDIHEATMRINGVSEEEINAYTEGFIGDMFSKIKEMFKKVWSKIKAIFQGFIARLEAQFGKNNKQFVEKYRNTVLTKDLTDFEPKHRPRKTSNAYPSFEGVVTILNPNLNTGKWISKTADQIQKDYDDFDEEKELDTLIGGLGSNFKDYKEFEKDLMDYLFDDETEEKVNIHTVMGDLIGFKNIKKEANKCNDSINKAFNKLVQQIDKDHSNFSKEFPTGKGEVYAKAYGIKKTGTAGTDLRFEKDDDQYAAAGSGTVQAGTGGAWKVSDDGQDNTKGGSGQSGESAQKYQKIMGLVSKYAHLGQQVATKYTQCIIKALNFENKQNRTIFAKAVAYNRKKNEEVMMEAMAELAEWEADY